MAKSTKKTTSSSSLDDRPIKKTKTAAANHVGTSMLASTSTSTSAPAAASEVTMTIPRKSSTNTNTNTTNSNNKGDGDSSSSAVSSRSSTPDSTTADNEGPTTTVSTSRIPKKTENKGDSLATIGKMNQDKAGRSSNANFEQQNSSANASDSSQDSDPEDSTVVPTTSAAPPPPSSVQSPSVPSVPSPPAASGKASTIKAASSTATPSKSKPIEKHTTKKVEETKSGTGTDGPLPPPKKKKGRPPKIDVTIASSSGGEGGGGKSPAPAGAAQDQHPYARSAVVEVWHGVEDPSDENWWSEDSDDEDQVVDTLTTPIVPNDSSNAATTTATTTATATAIVVAPIVHKTKLKAKQGVKPSVRLADVIDRISLGDAADGKWRYYIHYRDFNRRMDEWVSMERIVSPPSVGNAKARAIKKEEERQKRKQAREEEKKAKEIIDVLAPRARRRRTSLTAEAGGGDTTGTLAVDTPRSTRRRKIMDDDATVVTGSSSSNNNNLEGWGADAPPPPAVVVAAENGIVVVPTAAVHTHAVGEHIVETIAAQELDEHEGLDEASLREHEEVTKVKNVAFLELGSFQMETWYFSPLPKELLSERGLIEVLYVCEFTLNLFSRKTELQRFQARLPVHARHPPGNELYRNGNLAMFEVDGFDERIYCQNLCYIAKLFLDHKTLYFDVDPFLFYVLCEVDERGFHPVGYYSKEKYSDVGYNLACILTFPCHQRKGYGRFLIAFSYELSKKEEKVGSPEKPMSDLGQQAYKPYWASTIVEFLLNQAPETSNMSIMDISKITSIMAEDIVFTLNQLGILKIINSVYFVAAEDGLLRTLAKKYPVKEPRVDPSRLHWSPYVTDIKRDKFSIHSKKPSVEGDEMRGSGGF